MDALELLTTRSSSPRLQAPAPSAEQWQTIQKAAVRVPDHAGLQPWQFIVFDDEVSLNALGELYAKAALMEDANVDDAVVEKAKTLPHRAPMVIACIAKYVEHPKVPRIEQIATVSCSVMAMQQAAFAMGFGGIWRTGSYAHNPHMKTLLNLAAEDEIVGYLYLGSAMGDIAIKPQKPIDTCFVKYQP